MTLNDLSTLPPRPLTTEELEGLDTTGWNRVPVSLIKNNPVNRFPFSANEPSYWIGNELWKTITPQSMPLDIVHAIFWRDWEDGNRVTLPISVEPIEEELSLIADRREALRKFHAGKQ